MRVRGLGPDCSIKDSFVDLDLAPYGWSVLLNGVWIARSPTPGHRTADPPLRSGWSQVDNERDLAQWRSGRDTATAFTPALLADPDAVLLSRGGTPDVGCTINTGTDALGIGNVRTADLDPALVWSEIVEQARHRRAGATLVGWELPDDLAGPRAAGFVPVGRLRVWVRR